MLTVLRQKFNKLGHLTCLRKTAQYKAPNLGKLVDLVYSDVDPLTHKNKNCPWPLYKLIHFYMICLSGFDLISFMANKVILT